MERDETQAIVQKALDTLGEHFEAVQIMVSWNEQGTTRLFNLGSGNWYARMGMAHEFVKSDEAQTLASEIRSDK